MGKRILVVGAGPKAVGLAAKASAIHNQGLELPEIEIWDQIGIATNWQGQHGYTDGDQPLGTSPEKDIGFPYASSQSWHEDDTEETSANSLHEGMVRFSWMSYLIAQGRWAAWVDSGRPQPSHRRWGKLHSMGRPKSRRGIV